MAPISTSVFVKLYRRFFAVEISIKFFSNIDKIVLGTARTLPRSPLIRPAPLCFATKEGTKLDNFQNFTPLS